MNYKLYFNLLLINMQKIQFSSDPFASSRSAVIQIEKPIFFQIISPYRSSGLSNQRKNLEISLQYILALPLAGMQQNDVHSIFFYSAPCRTLFIVDNNLNSDYSLFNVIE